MPKTVAKRIISMQTKFFWGKCSSKSCIATVKWEQIQLPKEYGGLGIGDLLVKNAALLFKWWGRFYSEENSMWKKIVASCNDIDRAYPLWMNKNKNSGSAWSSICNIWKINNKVEKIVKIGICMLVGNGKSTLF